MEPLRPEFEARLLKTVEAALDRRRRLILANAILADVKFWSVGLGPKPPRSHPCSPEQQEAAMSTVRAKFFVSEVAKTTWGGRVKLNVVSRGEENKEWASATPTGSIETGIRNDHALMAFEPGAEFYVDFTPAPKTP